MKFNAKVLLASSTILVSSVISVAFAETGEEVTKNMKYTCPACHAVDAKMVGPSYKEIAKFYKNDKKKVDTLAKFIKEGAPGGTIDPKSKVPMPKNDLISVEAAKAAAEYILGLK